MEHEPRSLITDEHRAVIGVLFDLEPVTITAELVRDACALFEESDPRYAEGTGIAPPYILANLMREPEERTMPAVLPGSLLTQHEIRIERPLRVGEQLRPVARLTDLRERLGGRYGHVVLVLTTTDYYDAGGALVASNTATITQLDPANRREEMTE